jgi:hypothetical protein
MNRIRTLLVGLPTLTLLLAGSILVAAGSSSAALTAKPVVDQTVVGIHNAYEKQRFPYLIDALESGTAMIELDVWMRFPLFGSYVVGHDGPPNNNCAAATEYAQLRSGERNQRLHVCLDNIGLWHQRQPDHPLLMIKIEMKRGFDDRNGYGPDEFDRLLVEKFGRDVVFKPSDLLAGQYATLDEASRAGAWPSRDTLRGRIMVLVQRGTAESLNPQDDYHTEVEYADYLHRLAQTQSIDSAMMFPTVLERVTATDPRTGSLGDNRKPWLVTFDAEARDWARIDTSFYTGGHYLVIMTAAHAVVPPISDRTPTVEQAQARIDRLADLGASVVSSDWRPELDPRDGVDF